MKTIYYSILLATSIVFANESVFSAENEINFFKVLSKDTTIDGYKRRIELLEERKEQAVEESEKVLPNFPNVYSPLEPKKKEESEEDFSIRFDEWNKEGIRQYKELQQKYSSYILNLDNTISTLNNYILEAQMLEQDKNYLVSKAAAKDATENTSEKSLISGVGIVRIVAFTAAAAFTGVAIFKHLEASETRDRIDDLTNNVPGKGAPEEEAWKSKYNTQKGLFEDRQDLRNIFGIAAGACATAGIVTFFF